MGQPAASQSTCLNYRRPTFMRWVTLVSSLKQFSLLRALQYETLSTLKMVGPVLDFGGGDRASYRHLVKVDHYSSVNIDSSISPTWLVEIDGKIPCGDGQFRTLLSMNTFEHIYDARAAIAEAGRCLAAGGKFIAAVPFLFPVHGHPDDYFRPTPSWFGKTLTDVGFVNIEILPMYWGPFSNGAALSGLPGPAKSLRLALSMLMDLCYAVLKPDQNAAAARSALGYFVFATRI
jgi:SAM-dependent methyltransferase